MTYTHGTDSGPECSSCATHAWLYGYLDDETLEARCVSCHRREHHHVRAVLPDVRQIRLQHQEALSHGS